MVKMKILLLIYIFLVSCGKELSDLEKLQYPLESYSSLADDNISETEEMPAIPVESKYNSLYRRFKKILFGPPK